MLLLLAVLGACQQTSTRSLKISQGGVLPAFTLQDLRGAPIASDQVLTGYTLLNIWGTWCPPCRNELPSLQRLQTRLQKEGIQVVGLALDADDHVVREFLIERNVVYPNFLDRDHRIALEVLGIRFFPTTLLLDPEKNILAIIEREQIWDSPAMVEYLVKLKSGILPVPTH